MQEVAGIQLDKELMDLFAAIPKEEPLNVVILQGEKVGK